MIEFARYENAEGTSIAASIEGQTWSGIVAGTHLWGEVAEWATEEGNTIDAFAPVVAPAAVDAERDRRVAAGFMFAGKLYQGRPEDRENMAGASLAAFAAVVNGAEAGDLRWHGGDTDFAWIATDNSLTPMDAQTVFAFGQAAMAHKQAMIFAARALKDVDPIPADYADDAYWP
ncbi:MAG: DUF4376 domain-containing protein [Mesorhizobium sp.]|nr:DUF4376 domain-containing protein [Mesorhizobium sp.]